MQTKRKRPRDDDPPLPPVYQQTLYGTEVAICPYCTRELGGAFGVPKVWAENRKGEKNMKSLIEKAISGNKLARIELSKKLKPCPFCGARPKYNAWGYTCWYANTIDNDRIYISCCSDKHSGLCLQVSGDTFEEAERIWNMRPAKEE